MILLCFRFFNLLIASVALILLLVPTLTTAETNTAITPSASSSQNSEDQFLLGRSYYRGEGVAQSYEQAGFWYRKAADQGNLKAMHNLGIMFLEGQGTKKDEAAGYAWIRKAAASGDPRASYLCGVLLCEGRGVKKDTTEGLVWLGKSAELGYANAVARLGRDYFYGGDGVIPNPQKGLQLIRTAAEKGNPWAMGALGEIYENGGLLPKDLEKAHQLFQQGAELGDPASQFHWATYIMLTDPVKAYPWIRLAVDAHEVRAIGLMTECQLHLNPKQVAEGDAIAKKFRQKYQP